MCRFLDFFVQMDNETKSFVMNYASSHTIDSDLKRSRSHTKSDVPPKSEDKHISFALSQHPCWNFNVFQFNEDTNGRPLYFVGQALFRAHELIEKFNINEIKLHNFLKAIEAGYRKDNPYHNAIHAADVAMSMDFLLHRIGLDKCKNEALCLF